MEKFAKTPDQIADQIEHWFLDYHDREKSAFDGTEAFTLFHLLPRERKAQLRKHVHLKRRERPVLILSCGDGSCILNTTERFIKVPGPGSGVETLPYQEFSRHYAKTDGHSSGFGLEKRNGELLHWSIPPGRPGLAFWNVTKKCELIGRKYL